MMPARGGAITIYIAAFIDL